MKYYKTTLFNPGPPIDMDDTQVVYLEAPDPAELLCVAMDTHSKPVKDYEEVTKDVYDANQ
tara:strand:+ start:273 stop:455 length:183 start_codon:yes stop_codon:yes gene_type:complete